MGLASFSVASVDRMRLWWEREVLLGFAIMVIASLAISARPGVGSTNLESSDMREIDQLLNRIHKKDGYDGHSENHGTKLAGAAEAHDTMKKAAKRLTHKKTSAQGMGHAPPAASPAAHAGHANKALQAVVAVYHHKKLGRRDRHAEGHRRQENRHVNSALEKAMAAENAAMHSSLSKKPSPKSEAKTKSIEEKMRKIQVSVRLFARVSLAVCLTVARWRGDSAMRQFDSGLAHPAELPTSPRLPVHSLLKCTLARFRMRSPVWQEQITADYKSVTKFGKKAGYLPPVKMPHV